MSKMLFIQSNDYWGYDAASFDDSINFYKMSWTVPESQYEGMSEDEKKRLYPCALFYVAGVTDNHNFLTLKIVKDSKEAKVSGMEGSKRRTRRYEIGSPAQYSVGSYALQAAPSSATNISEIKEAVESGSTSPGSFNVSGFLDDAKNIAEAVNYTEEKSAESFAAPATEPSGSAYEPADPTVANPSTEGPSESELITMDAEIEYAELGEELYPIVPNTTGQDSSFNGRGVPQWYGAEGSGDIDHDSFDEDKEVEVTFRYDRPTSQYQWSVSGDLTEEEEDFIIDGIIEELGSQPSEGEDDFNVDLEDGREAYVETETDYGEGRFYGLAAEEGGRLRDIGGKFMNRRKAKNAVFGEVMSQQMGGYYRTGIVGDNPPVGQDISRRNPVAKAKYFVQPGVQNENSGAWSKGPNFQQARKIAKGVAWDTVQDMGLAAEGFEAESFCADCGTTKKYRGEEEGCGCGSMELNAESWGETDQYTIEYLMGYRMNVSLTDRVREMVNHRKEGDVDIDLDTLEWFINNMEIPFGNKEEALEIITEEKDAENYYDAEMEYAELGDELYPIIPNSEGGNTALDSGRGVPQWYGSAEQGYNDKMDESLGMRHRGRHSQSMKDRRDEAASMDKMHSMMGRKYDDVSTMDAQGITETLEEASPVKGVLVAPAVAAIAGIVAGVFYARRS